MGKHVINGIDYSGGSGGSSGGGGDNSVEILYADYLALSDAERNNGTIYYITDANPVSVGDESNMKYDPETDIKYLKNKDGNWVFDCYGGLIDFDVLNTSISQWTKVSSYIDNPVFELSSSLLKIGSQDGGTEYGTGDIIYRTELKDFSKYNVLRITGTHHYHMWNNTTAYGYINLVDINGNKTNIYTKSFGGQIGEVDYTLPTSIDLMAYDGEYYVEFYLQDKTSNQKFEIISMIFSAD